MFDRIRKAVQTLEQELKDLDPDTLHPKDAPHLLELYSRGERLCAAGKALAAGRVAQSGAWRTKGDRSPAHFVSRATGDSIGASVTAITTAQKMADLPVAGKAFRRGDLTAQAAAEIASAATLAPDKQTHLLQVVKKKGSQDCEPKPAE